MGCGGSVQGKGVYDPVKELLKRSEDDLAEERRRLEEKEKQLAYVEKQLRSSEQATASRSLSATAEELRSQLEETLRAREEIADRSHDALMKSLQEASSMEKQLQEAHDERRRCEQRHRDFEEDLNRRQLLLQAELQTRTEEGRRAQLEANHFNEALVKSLQEVSSMEQRLLETQNERHRCEQRHQDLQEHLSSQHAQLQSELRVRTEDLHQRKLLLKKRDEQLTEVNAQLSELQRLFNDVNQELRTECGRLGGLQDTVSLCAQQSKDVEHLEAMLEEAHGMLAQVQETLQEERNERLRVQGLLEHEKHRTQLLLDVLKHFKEKLQGLTPQVLLSRLGSAMGPEAKALLLSNLGPAGDIVGNDLICQD